MSCRICKRGSCTESFHSFEEQNLYEKKIELMERGKEWLMERVLELEEELAAVRLREDSTRD